MAAHPSEFVELQKIGYKNCGVLSLVGVERAGVRVISIVGLVRVSDRPVARTCLGRKVLWVMLEVGIWSGSRRMSMKMSRWRRRWIRKRRIGGWNMVERLKKGKEAWLGGQIMRIVAKAHSHVHSRCYRLELMLGCCFLFCQYLRLRFATLTLRVIIEWNSNVFGLP